MLWWEGCASTEDALRAVRDALAEFGLRDHEVKLVEIRTDKQAREIGFAGSPTILIDGVDLVKLARRPAVPGPDVPMLSCRLYRLRDGQISRIPDPQDIRDALETSLARGRR